MDTLFYYRTPLRSIDDVCLLHPEAHWKPEKSAQSLAMAWLDAGGFPLRVKDVLNRNPVWRDARLVEGLFEYLTPLETPGEPSHTDLMCFFCLADGNRIGIIAVEGKARESFGETVEKWNSSPGRQRRLDRLSDLLSINKQTVNNLRWQLFHRAAAAVFEAKRWGAHDALLLVHSFKTSPKSESDFLKFATALGARNAGVDQVSDAVVARNVNLRLSWVQER